MFRPLLFCLLLASIAGGSGSSDSKSSYGAEFIPALRGTTNSQYVHYLWNEDGADRILSVAKMSDLIAMCRLYDLSTRKETQGAIEFYIDPNGEHRVKPKTYYDDPTEEDLDRLLFGATTIVCLSQDNPDYPITERLVMKLEDPESGETQLAEFAHWVPFSGLVSLTTAGADRPHLRLVALGRFFGGKSFSDDVQRFFFVDKVPSGKAGKKYRIKPKKAKTVVQAGLSYKLDTNWILKKKRPDLGLPHETYWFEPEGVRVAQIGVETFDANDIASFPDLLVKMIQTNVCVLPDETTIEKTRHAIRVRYTMIDPVKGLENYLVYDYYPGSKGRTYSLSFSCLKSLYDVNKDYFIKIFDSVVPVDAGSRM